MSLVCCLKEPAACLETREPNVPFFVPTVGGIWGDSVLNGGTPKSRIEPRIYCSNALRTTRSQIAAKQLLTGGLLVRRASIWKRSLSERRISLTVEAVALPVTWSTPERPASMT
jgi:hypothetical protein